MPIEISNIPMSTLYYLIATKSTQHKTKMVPVIVYIHFSYNTILVMQVVLKRSSEGVPLQSNQNRRT